VKIPEFIQQLFAISEFSEKRHHMTPREYDAERGRNCEVIPNLRANRKWGDQRKTK
jgi:hypothetical protein